MNESSQYLHYRDWRLEPLSWCWLIRAKRSPPQVNSSHMICSCEKKTFMFNYVYRKKLLKNSKAAYFFQKNKPQAPFRWVRLVPCGFVLSFVFFFLFVLFELKNQNPMTCFNSSSTKKSISFVQMFWFALELHKWPPQRPWNTISIVVFKDESSVLHHSGNL